MWYRYMYTLDVKTLLQFFRSRDEELMYKFKAYAGLHGPNDVSLSS